MKTIKLMLILVCLLLGASASAVDIELMNGKVYKDAKVIEIVKPGKYIKIEYSDGKRNKKKRLKLTKLKNKEFMKMFLIHDIKDATGEIHKNHQVVRITKGFVFIVNPKLKKKDQMMTALTWRQMSPEFAELCGYGDQVIKRRRK